jgi:hypothetical protein
MQKPTGFIAPEKFGARDVFSEHIIKATIRGDN